MTDPTHFHETWLGMVQPDGLVVSIPVLVDHQVADAQPPSFQRKLVDHSPGGVIRDLPSFLSELLRLTPDLFRAPTDAETLYVPESGETVAPTLVLPDRLLLQDLPSKDLDAPDDSAKWRYPPAAKFDRLLRHARVPIGLLTNRTEVRLVYAPAGESTGVLTFRIADMSDVGGRPILDAFATLLSHARLFTVPTDAQLPNLLKESRERQANVTTTLASQVREALEILLAGFEAASLRDASSLLEDARSAGKLTEGLLTVLLRLVFLLYAEDRGLMPSSPLYTENLSVLGLFARLKADAALHPDTMPRRHGAWSRLVALFRAVYLGMSHGELTMPARRGDLFNPHRFPFLEGWEGPSAPIATPEVQSAVRVPTVDDETILRVLEKLVVLEGQRLSYRALDVEQIGSVYEGLMGFDAVRLDADAVCVQPERVWVTADAVRGKTAKALQEETGLSKSQATKLAAALSGAKSEAAVLEALETFRAKGTTRAAAGRLVLQPGPERRRTSSHYTPRSLSAPIVRKTLEPLLRAMGPSPSSERILSLKVCDPAMGSGAFLVEACRFLAEEVVKAWQRESVDLGRLPDPLSAARRLVAQRCLYGVDKNPFATSLAKLALWLVTLAKDLPFTFLDHALRTGDSLVGLSFDQIRAFHWKPKKQLEISSKVLDEALSEAIEIRQQILKLAADPSPAAQREKELLLADAEDAIDRVRLLGDLVIGAFFSATKDKEREKERNRRLDLVEQWLSAGGPTPDEIQSLRPTFPIFHWMAEFPEIFYDARPDPLEDDTVNHAAWIDAFVGNPPFLGQPQISASLGNAYRDWLFEAHTGAHGKTDLVVHFFRRASVLLGKHGTIGLIGTNTIAQGDTRESGLQWLLRGGLLIYDATSSMAWPGDAAVAVSVVHLAKGTPSMNAADIRLNGARVTTVNSRLDSAPERQDSKPLASNAELGFRGCCIGGLGFVLSSDERTHLIAKDRRNAERILPYIGGEEINTSPQQAFDRYVIDFGQLSLEEASAWPDLIDLVRERVKPYRDTVKRDSWRKRWWQFAEVYPAMRAAIRTLPRCLVASRVTKHVCPSFQSTDRIYADSLCVFALDHFSAFAALQSRVHETWARLLSSSMRTDLRYSVADAFETYPFPCPDPRAVLSALEAIGQALYESRTAYMLSTNQGLTATYNALKEPTNTDPRIVGLRHLHESLDRAVLTAYGWDLQVPPYCAPAPAALTAFEDAVVDRLFQLNAAREGDGAAAHPRTVE